MYKKQEISHIFFTALYSPISLITIHILHFKLAGQICGQLSLIKEHFYLQTSKLNQTVTLFWSLHELATEQELLFSINKPRKIFFTLAIVFINFLLISLSISFGNVGFFLAGLFGVLVEHLTGK